MVELLAFINCSVAVNLSPGQDKRGSFTLLICSGLCHRHPSLPLPHYFSIPRENSQVFVGSSLSNLTVAIGLFSLMRWTPINVTLNKGAVLCCTSRLPSPELTNTVHTMKMRGFWDLNACLLYASPPNHKKLCLRDLQYDLEMPFSMVGKYSSIVRAGGRRQEISHVLKIPLACFKCKGKS